MKTISTSEFRRRQKAYFKKNGKYTSSKNLLTIPKTDLRDYVFNPRMEVTNSMFEITVESYDGNGKWHIRQDGLIWLDGDELRKEAMGKGGLKQIGG